MWETIEYVKANGRRPTSEFLDSLPIKQREKVIRNMLLLERFGLRWGMPFTEHLGDGIWELRTKISSNIYRVLLFHWKDNYLVFTHGFTKKTQKTPKREIEKAKRYRADFLNNPERSFW
ncbi:type II toxin-antitoxin system RelE/ParE family toxin [Thermoactinomyces sp. CICC 10522]|uniref:type II toxin-antitoxin system RelE/ParE family toxin n=1 Tax=Thermoactinomyces sp. CICC 10522 TaxID=2767427 RepID=UPI0018DCFAD2|nr:type II toxin-antitoxin system RelE/ParE family toxin [Thermoactinomyces sp. CICC 10522]MBH8605909.1 type II toxin-antitoxin system RelE/ParE family toxin [Thermoactinomyces sp. CICC 10522]